MKQKYHLLLLLCSIHVVLIVLHRQYIIHQKIPQILDHYKCYMEIQIKILW